MLPLVYFENTFSQTIDDDLTYDAAACITIDGYPEDEHASGEVVARIYMTKNRDIIVDWRDCAYQNNTACMELIGDSIRQLKDAYPKNVSIEPGVTFVDACDAGICDTNDIHAYIEYWHTHQTGNSLPEFLGMTKDQYAAWLKNSTRLSDIIRIHQRRPDDGLVIPSVDGRLARIIRRNYIGQNNLHYRFIKQLNHLENEMLDHALTHDVDISENRDAILQNLVKISIISQLVMSNYDMTQDELNAEFERQITNIRVSAVDNI